jgi:replicative DNA helicase
MRQEIIKELIDIIAKPDISERELLTQLRLVIEKPQTSATYNTVSLAQLYNQQVTSMLAGQHKNNILRTGFKNVDEIIGGFFPGEFVVIGARPSMGKTQLLINLALNISRINPVLFFSFDLPDFMLVNRCISTLADIPLQHVLQPELATSKEKQQIAEISKLLNTHNIYINGGSVNNLSAFRQQCMDQIKVTGVKVIIVDTLQHVSLSRFRGNREQEISNFTRELKAIANETGVVVIASSQLSRSVETRKESKIPVLSDLRDSGCIEQDADKVIMIYRPEYHGITDDEMGESTEGETHLLIAKNKYGNLGAAKIQMLSTKTGFIDMEDSFERPKLFIPDFSFATKRTEEIHRK